MSSAKRGDLDTRITRLHRCAPRRDEVLDQASVLSVAPTSRHGVEETAFLGGERPQAGGADLVEHSIDLGGFAVAGVAGGRDARFALRRGGLLSINVAALGGNRDPA